MKKTAMLLAVLLLCSCGKEFAGLGSVDLQITSISFNDSDPAIITGILPAGKPADFILMADGPLIQRMRVICSDTAGMAEANDQVGFPLFYQIDPAAGHSIFRIDHMGLSWKPDYSIIQSGETYRVHASALLENMTIQTWQPDTIRFHRPGGSPVTEASGRITVRQGRSLIPWWDAPSGPPLPVLRYGWPVPGRWNPLLAVHCPAMGPAETWTGQVFPLNDTLYFPVDSLLDIDLSWQQTSTEYNCFLTATSLTPRQIRWTIQWPHRLPRGSAVEPGPDTISLSPGESVTITYHETFTPIQSHP